MELRRRRPSAEPALVLIVDGHDDTRELYAVGLPLFGFKTAPADGVGVAGVVARAREMHPDIIVMEIAHLYLDGWALVHELRQNPQTASIPLIVLTTRAEPSVRARAQLEGCVAVLVKPYPPDELALVLRAVLDHGAGD